MRKLLPILCLLIIASCSKEISYFECAMTMPNDPSEPSQFLMIDLDNRLIDWQARYSRGIKNSTFNLTDTHVEGTYPSSNTRYGPLFLSFTKLTGKLQVWSKIHDRPTPIGIVDGDMHAIYKCSKITPVMD